MSNIVLNWTFAKFRRIHNAVRRTQETLELSHLFQKLKNTLIFERLYGRVDVKLYCYNQHGDNIAVFKVNRKTCGLKFTGHCTPVGNPSIIVFLDLTKAD